MVVPFPYGTAKVAAQKALGRMGLRAPPLNAITVENERRFRAEAEQAFRTGDDAFAQIERRLRALEEAQAAYIQTPRVLQYLDAYDFSSYASTVTTPYATAGPFVEYVPKHPLTMLRVEALINFVCANDAAQAHVGIQSRLMYSDGAAYQTLTTAYADSRLSSVINAGATTTFNGQLIFDQRLAPAHRMPNGSYRLRVYFNTIYAGTATIKASAKFFLTEQLGIGVT